MTKFYYYTNLLNQRLDIIDKYEMGTNFLLCCAWGRRPTDYYTSRNNINPMIKTTSGEILIALKLKKKKKKTWYNYLLWIRYTHELAWLKKKKNLVLQNVLSS